MDDATAIRELSLVLSRSEDEELIEEFLRSILTDAEIHEIASRWSLVRLMDAGNSQRQIARELGLSLCKITRGSRELKKEHSAFKQMIDLFKRIASRESAGV